MNRHERRGRQAHARKQQTRIVHTGGKGTVKEPVFADQIAVGHQKDVFRMFVNQVQATGDGQVILLAHVVITPGHMKSLYKIIGDQIKEYEKRFGAIGDPLIHIPDAKVPAIN